jgi:hypothetical protein
VVTAALEVEAHSYDHEWKSEDEDTIRLIAHVSGSVLDMIDNIKLQVTSSSTSSLPTSHAAEIILLHHKDMRRVLLHLQFPKMTIYPLRYHIILSNASSLRVFLFARPVVHDAEQCPTTQNRSQRRSQRGRLSSTRTRKVYNHPAEIRVSRSRPLNPLKSTVESPGSRPLNPLKSTVESPSSPDKGNEPPRAPGGGHRIGGVDGGSSSSSRSIALIMQQRRFRGTVGIPSRVQRACVQQVLLCYFVQPTS